MMKSELLAKLTELFGDEDVDIYLDIRNPVFTAHFKVYIDKDGDAVIEVD